MAMNSFPAWGHRSQGLFSASDSPGPPRYRSCPCVPVPASVVTCFAFRSTSRSRWFSVSATYSFSPTSAIPWGWSKLASAYPPSDLPICPLPITSCSLPSSPAITIRLWLLSEMNSRCDGASASSLPGNRNGVAGTRLRSSEKSTGVSSSVPFARW